MIKRKEDARDLFVRSAEWFEQADAEFALLGHLDGVALVQNNRGVLAEKTGDLDGAVRWLQASLAEREKMGKPRAVVITRLSLGFVLEARGDFEAALEQFQRAARAGIEKQMPGWTVDALAGVLFRSRRSHHPPRTTTTAVEARPP